MLDDRVVLVTGGTGSFGRMFVKHVLAQHNPRKVIVFSRDELKQFEMRQELPPEYLPKLRFFIGDVRDKARLYRAFDGVDIVVHAAALKQVPAAEYNPIEAVLTNVMGAANVIDAAIDRGVDRVIALSTDKAANPVNLYGATKLCADKLFIAGNHYSGGHRTGFSVVRYGNVLFSRGSVVPFFLRKRETGVMPVTDRRMTRFSITLQQAVTFVLESLESMLGGEIFVPKIPSYRILDLVKAIAPECEIEVVGIRPGEKLHEVLVAPDDARHTVEYEDRYVILAPGLGAKPLDHAQTNGGKLVGDRFTYASNTNPWILSVEELREFVARRYPQPVPG